ncbi:DUF397 domain-containing protein [Kitasatospora aureofaciens]|uniref:DUF397 domain-containing protein n=1 Tax=Kitasatospora aureofaciens TaxID=1894 RepID=UPI001C44AE22|nr:DUF397 domain-containing protein [Kitasatospora aureofaciens]MBV6699644.1 DUF397 domain-containing protein [Kitasatospora aureofaciens]
MNSDLSGASWIKSSYSTNGGECVEISRSFPGTIPVRDSKDPEGPALLFPAGSWQSFVSAVRNGEFGAR